jgi:hypothetical protein
VSRNSGEFADLNSDVLSLSSFSVGQTKNRLMLAVNRLNCFGADDDTSALN